ncbi:MAG TPA: EAL domain-containing protein [Xanthobacteraceae bacterium]
MSERKRQLTFRGLIVTAAALIASAVVATVLTIIGLHGDATQDAERDAGNIATVLAEQTSHLVRAIDQTLIELQRRVVASRVTTPAEFRAAFSTDNTFDLLRDQIARLTEADVISLVGADGKIITSSRSMPNRLIDLSDRDYFQHAEHDGANQLYVSSPITNRYTGTRAIVFARRLQSANGTFLGAAIVNVKTSYFRHVYETASALTDRSFLFLRRDGLLLVRYPEVTLLASDVIRPNSPWYGLVARGGGYFRSPGVFDGVPRIVAVRPLADYPLVVNVGVSQNAALALWRRRATLIGLGAALTLLGFAFLLRAFVAQFRALMASEKVATERGSRLDEKSQELERANVRFDAALNNMSQGLCLFDAAARIVVCNQQYLQMYDLSPAVARPGCTLHDLIVHRKETGYFTGDVEQYCSRIMESVAEGQSFAWVVEASDGRFVHVLNRPIASGGWVATHEDVTERWRSEARIAHMARHDALTDLPNRVLIMEKMNEALGRLSVEGTKFCVFIFDLDLFKAVNDSLGHPIGDLLLKSVATRLAEVVTEPDTVGRLGGDEFAILQAVKSDGQAEATALAHRLIEAIGMPYELEGHPVVIGISMGIAVAPADGTDANMLLKHADLALYRAKSDGRNCFRFYEIQMDAAVQLRRALEVDLRNALARDEFVLHYQAVIDAATREPCGAEALVRWRHPRRGLMGPDQFIPLAEEIGLIDALGEWILREACAEAAKWPAHIRIAVNLSPAQFRRGHLADTVMAALARSGLPAHRLELEITESVLLQKSESNLAALHAIKRLGVSIVLDDFGTGYSSLGYLRMFPFDKIKIDRSFVQELASRSDCAAIVCAITGLARSLNIVATAEGVETEEQFALVRAAGCNLVQGYLFGKPGRPSALRWSAAVTRSA